MKPQPIISHVPVRGVGPDGSAYVRLEQHVRQRAPRFSLRFLFLAYGLGFATAMLGLMAASNP